MLIASFLTDSEPTFKLKQTIYKVEAKAAGELCCCHAFISM